MKNKIIYVPLAVDVLHSGHLNIINKAKKIGRVYIGLLTDNAISKYKKLPLLNYQERFKIVSNLKGIYKILKEDDWTYKSTIQKIKPDFFVHGDDWKRNNLKNIRQIVINSLRKINAKLIEIPYTKNISSSIIKNQISKYYKTTDRVSLLKRILESKKTIRILEAHNPISGLIVEKTVIEKKKSIIEFDAIWSSSLTDSTSRGKPDNQSVDFSTRFSGLNEILDVTTKPVLFDGDNGGQIEHLPYTIRTLERMGVSGICIEDKKGLKINSLSKDQTKAKQDTISQFSKKIKVASKSKLSKDFLIVARIESLILGKKVEDAFKRAKKYIMAGADAILIHSKDKDPKKIYLFLKRFKKDFFNVPVIVVPSSYPHIKFDILSQKGANAIIYANHLLRSAYPSMQNVAKEILINSRTLESEKKLMSIKKILSLC